MFYTTYFGYQSFHQNTCFFFLKEIKQLTGKELPNKCTIRGTKGFALSLLNGFAGSSDFISGDLFPFLFLSFQGHTCAIWRFPGYGLNQSCSHWPAPQPQQCRIQSTSANYTTALRNTGSLIHWVRPGIEFMSSWMLDRFVYAEPTMGTPGDLNTGFMFNGS